MADLIVNLIDPADGRFSPFLICLPTALYIQFDVLITTSARERDSAFSVVNPSSLASWIHATLTLRVESLRESSPSEDLSVLNNYSPSNAIIGHRHIIEKG